MESLHNKFMEAHDGGENPRQVLQNIFGIDSSRIVNSDATDEEIWRTIFEIAMLHEQRMMSRPRTYISDINQVVKLIQDAQNIVVIIGAGASVGPDFRSPGGLYDQIAKSGALDDPYQVFDLEYFVKDPSVFWRFAHTIFPAIEPDHSLTHFFLAALEEQGKLLRLYTQNVDTLEVGIPDEKLRCVHGSWRENKCIQCGQVHTIEDLRQHVEAQTVPTCKMCGGQIKPGIVFFGQRTNIEDDDLKYCADHGDLLIVIGTSLRVAPVSYIPRIMHGIPSILINREPVTCPFNAELLGNSDDIVKVLERELGWVKEDDKTAADFVFTAPNKFVLPSADGLGTTFVETGRNTFIVTPVLTTFEDQFD